MMKQIRTFLKVSPDKTDSDVIVGIGMWCYAFLFIVALVVGLVRESLE